MGSVETLDGVSLFSVSITASQTLQDSQHTVPLIKSSLLWSSKVIRKLLMEIKALDCPEKFTLINLLDVEFVDMNKAELFTSDLRAAFVMTRANEGFMLLLAF